MNHCNERQWNWFIELTNVTKGAAWNSIQFNKIDWMNQAASIITVFLLNEITSLHQINSIHEWNSMELNETANVITVWAAAWVKRNEITFN